MALNSLGLGFVFTARDLASGTMAKVSTAFKANASAAQKSAAITNAAFASIGLGVVGLTAGLVGLGIGVKLANSFGAFGKTIEGIGVITRATDEELRQLEESAIQAGLKTQFSPDEAAEGLQNLATAGLSAKNSMKALIPTLDLATGSLGQLGVGDAAAAVVGTLNAFGKSADEATSVTDKLLRITQLTNFQAGDFAIGLSKAAAAGGQFRQSLDDTLIVMGLLRNRNIDASSSSTAVRESLRRIGSDQNAQKALKEAGVSAFDASGNMRSMIDTMLDLKEATSDMNDEERNAIVVRAFGARGLLAFNAVTTESAERIAELRAELADAGGTAETFKNKLLDTFEGQKQLLGGVMQTFGVVLGKGFAAVFKPFVAAFAQGMTLLTTFLAKMPDGIKTAVAGLVVFFSVGTIVASLLLLLGGAIALLAPIAGTIGTVFGIAVAAALPLIAAFASLSAGAVMLYEAVQRNIGGLGDYFAESFRKASLAFEGLVQLISTGKISGAVAEQLSKAENEGILNFITKLFLIVERVKAFFQGIGEGVSAGLGDAEPAIKDLVSALTLLGQTLGFVGSEVDQGANAEKFDQMASAGARVGKALASAFTFAIRQITIIVLLVQEGIDFFREFEGSVAPLGNSLNALGAAFSRAGEQMASMFGTTTEGVSAWDILVGAIKIGVFLITGVLGGLISIFAGIVSIVGGVVSGVVGAFMGLYTMISGLVNLIVGIFTGDWNRAWEGAKNVVFGVVQTVINLVGGMLEGVAGMIDSFVEGTTGTKGGLGAQKFLQGGREQLLDDLGDSLGLKQQTVTGQQQDIIDAGLSQRSAAVAQAQTTPIRPAADKQKGGTDPAALAEAFASAGQGGGFGPGGKTLSADEMAAALSAGAAKQKPPNVVTNLRVELDGAEIAAALESDGRGFGPGTAAQD